jgi:hypothetical protein
LSHSPNSPYGRSGCGVQNAFNQNHFDEDAWQNNCWRVGKTQHSSGKHFAIVLGDDPQGKLVGFLEPTGAADHPILDGSM